MGKEIIRFGNIEVEKHKIQQQKRHVSTCNVNIYRIVVFKACVCYFLSFFFCFHQMIAL